VETTKRCSRRDLADERVDVLGGDAGFASLADVVTKRKAERMRSFVIAEALDYFWWLFSPPAELDLDGVVFKTQAHALRRVADPVEAALPLRRRRRPSASH
jgi:mannosidase alpha-like ER degradation enhancer 1